MKALIQNGGVSQRDITKRLYISRSRWNKGYNKWINVHWSHGHHNKILWLFLSFSFVFLWCYYLWWTKEIKYFDGLFLLKWLLISCKMEAIIEKEITLVGSHNFYIIINWGRVTCTIQNLRHMVPFIISNKYSTIFMHKVNTMQKPTNWALCHLIIKFSTWKLYKALVIDTIKKVFKKVDNFFQFNQIPNILMGYC